MTHAGPGGELEDNLNGWEVEVLSENAWEPEIGKTTPLAKPLIKPSLYDGKDVLGWLSSSIWTDCRIKWLEYVNNSYLPCHEFVRVCVTDLDKNSRRGYQALRDALLLQFDNSGKMEVFRSKLKSHVRGKDESLPELTQLIQVVRT